MNVRETIKSQIVKALEGTVFPIATPIDLLASFPNGANTVCKAGDVEITAGEAGKLLINDDFPFHNAEDAAETIVTRAGL